MTQQESFKRRIRARMAKTGERYGAARRRLIEQSTDSPQWVAEPETSDEAVTAATGRTWNEWCDLILAWPGRTDGHAAIASHLQAEHELDGWWAQTVTVGYERITGIRLPHQRPDGTFTAAKSRTVQIDAGLLRAMLLDDSERDAIFPGLRTDLRSRPGSKALRISIGPGVAQIAIDERPDGKVKVTVSHEQLPEAADVPLWKAYWSEWLDALAER